MWMGQPRPIVFLYDFSGMRPRQANYQACGNWNVTGLVEFHGTCYPEFEERRFVWTDFVFVMSYIFLGNHVLFAVLLILVEHSSVVGQG